ncbi:30S ribosomal protein S9 [Rhodohalobacter sp.]|uniref:30S ribosomal protein S9 n=1 Tax=Rhodohalobacter sp. TaxID=1974210 RepID=UPI002ACE580E|nr:30S ribosomal protein S9 [Rhodohalobacter sp.]MDZ7755388.1 30S ribosomal protein S9 [Rhodohalobacter sp.]
MAQENYIGRRKTSTARLYIKDGSGEFIVNGKPLTEHLNTQARVNIARLPMDVTELDGKYDIKVTVSGGGVTGQAGAISLALARAIDDLNEGLHDVLKEHGLLTRDDRMVERKKYGQPKARKKFQFSKR